MDIKKVYDDGLIMVWTEEEYMKILEIKRRPGREKNKQHYSRVGSMNGGFKRW